MFTSRAEYRLMLREDNADLRLTEAGRKLGLVDDERWDAFCRKRDAIAGETERLKGTRAGPHSLYEMLRRPEVSYRSLSLKRANYIDDVVAEQVEIQAKYEGYIERQGAEVRRRHGQESTSLPAAFDYGAVRGLSNEVRQTLARQRPETIGQAARISGVTPAAISLLLVHLRRGANRAPGRKTEHKKRA
jgi:tRNA uridine 5-carboxymethylaminomethyl modification enzyme